MRALVFAGVLQVEQSVCDLADENAVLRSRLQIGQHDNVDVSSYRTGMQIDVEKVQPSHHATVGAAFNTMPLVFDGP